MNYDAGKTRRIRLWLPTLLLFGAGSLLFTFGQKYIYSQTTGYQPNNTIWYSTQKKIDIPSRRVQVPLPPNIRSLPRVSGNPIPNAMNSNIRRIPRTNQYDTNPILRVSQNHRRPTQKDYSPAYSRYSNIRVSQKQSILPESSKVLTEQFKKAGDGLKSYLESFNPSMLNTLSEQLPNLPTLPLEKTEAEGTNESNLTGQTIELPLPSADLGREIKIDSQNGLISLDATGASLSAVLDMLAQDQKLNIILSDTISKNISLRFKNVPLDDALNSILAATGYAWVRKNNIVIVSKISDGANLSPATQGRELLVIDLNFLAAVDVEKVLQGLLSPVGTLSFIESDTKDKRKTQERIVVEDLPEYLKRIDAYIQKVDRPPRQVLIEAHILQVTLGDDVQHGVNFNALADIANADLSIRTQGFASATASPAFILDLNGSDLIAVVEALKETTDAKTLASPKVMVINGQDSRIQIGAKLAYVVTTTTETSTLESVEFLDVGVLLEVTPQITDDNRILMYVKPKVSSGIINPNTGLPDEETAEVETSVLLPNGKGMIIGGLIQEIDSDRQIKIPWLGDMWLVGRLFQRRVIERERSEIVIALIPRIVPYDVECFTDEHESCFIQEQVEVERATTRLLHNPLDRNLRPWEPELKDATVRQR